MLKILFVASEAVPFIKTGGLGDVTGSLPKALKDMGIDVRLIIPKYRDIAPYFRERTTMVETCTVPLAWRKQYCGIERLDYNGIICYFLDNEFYFRRHGLYGYGDDAERFAFFSKAVLEAIPRLDFLPDLLHCHDWQTGMVSLFWQAFYRNNPLYAQLRTLFTIHNLQYQGVFPRSVLGDVMGLSDAYFTHEGVEFYGQVNSMKAGLVYSDYVTTVSSTYAEEIQTPYYGEGLDGLLRARRHRLSGIINGIDYAVYNPSTDPLIFANYDEHSLHKQENKDKLQEQLRLPVRRDVPMIAIVSRLVESKGFDLVAAVLDEILAMDIQLVILGTGEERYNALFNYAAWRYPDKVSTNNCFDEALARQIYAASDLFLMPSRFEPCGISQLIALRYGSLPIVRKTGGLKDTVRSYNEYTGEGNGFTFSNYNAHDMLFTIKRAVEIFDNKILWTKILCNAMRSNYGWQESARRYHCLYKKLIHTGVEDV